MNYNKLTEKDGYILIDGMDINKELTTYDDNGFIERDYGLVSSLCNENQGEIRYIKELISRKLDCNFPILICDCDCDFHCTIAVVKAKFCDDCVKWEKIGIVSGKEKTDRKVFFEKYRNSGIRRVEDWTDKDWEKYGDIAYDLLQDDNFFDDWCGKNWQNELYRRCWGYYHKYFNNDNNIDWTSELDYKFQMNEYQKFFCGESV
ncbi:MAG: hypothetical protein K2N27_11205 [Ruminococcus sp.]|nr:hypothetical protein [Ruminococcus sp.]